jgi:integrase
MAEANLRKIQTLVDEGRYLEKKRDPKETLGEFSKKYLKWCEDTQEKAFAKKKSRLTFVVNKLGKDVKLSKIGRADVEKFQAERLNTPGPKKKCVTKATVNRDVSVVKHMFSKAVEWGILDSNPLRGIKKLRETGRRLRYLTPEECELLISKCSPTLAKIVILALHTGMRKSEILHLVWENVNLREKYIELVDQKNGERSTIPLNRTVIDTLRSIPRSLASKYVFPGKKSDKPFYDLKRQFEKAVADANLQGVTFHILSHLCQSSCYGRR